jgi:nitrite reductase/ring-hydroxylating ferredoxin subunit
MATPTDDSWRLRPNAPASGSVLGDAALVAEGQARQFVFGRGRSAFGMFVVRRDGRYFGYLNLCPHYSLPLNHQADRFLNDGQIECVQHFARFAIEDGRCLSGACEGEGLWRIPVIVTPDGQLAIA